MEGWVATEVGARVVAVGARVVVVAATRVLKAVMSAASPGAVVKEAVVTEAAATVVAVRVAVKVAVRVRAIEARREAVKVAAVRLSEAQEGSWAVVTAGMVVAEQVMLSQLGRALRGMARSGSPALCTGPPSCQKTESGASSRCCRGCR